MKRRLKTIAIVGAFMVLLVGMLAAVAVRFIDVDRYRPEVEAAISEATGLDCSLGTLSLRLWPLPNLRIEHPALNRFGRPILKAERITLSAHLLPLLSRRLELRSITVHKLTGTIRRDRQGHLNLLPPKRPESREPLAFPLSTLHITTIALTDAELRYEDAATGFTAAAKGLDFAIGPLHVMEHGNMVLTSRQEFFAAAWEGSLKARSLTLNALTLDRPALEFAAGGRNLTLDPVAASIYGGVLQGTLTATGLGKNPQFAATATIKDLDLARLSAAVNHKGQIAGRLQAATALTTNGTGRMAMLRRLDGNVAMHGANLTIHNIDLDTILSQYAKSQEIGLLDLGSIFILGPFGPLLSKTVDLSGATLGVGRGSSRITQFVSDWTMQDGIARTSDVAMATPKHRLAFKGRVDLPAERFLDFRVGILDQRGCATFSQTINGSFRAPQVEKASFIAKTVVTPLVSLFQKGVTALRGGKPTTCTPFYTGRVPHPATP